MDISTLLRQAARQEVNIVLGPAFDSEGIKR